MPETSLRPNPLAEIEALQDRVLRELDELNERLERTLLEYGGGAARNDPAPIVACLPIVTDRPAAA